MVKVEIPLGTTPATHEADLIEVDDIGALHVLARGPMSNDLVAVYAPDHWKSAVIESVKTS